MTPPLGATGSAYTLLKEHATLLPKMSPETKDAFQRLVTRINETLDSA